MNRAREGHNTPTLDCDYHIELSAQKWADKLADDQIAPDSK